MRIACFNLRFKKTKRSTTSKKKLEKSQRVSIFKRLYFFFTNKKKLLFLFLQIKKIIFSTFTNKKNSILFI